MELRGNIINTLLWMKRQGYPESSLKSTSRRLRHLLKYCNLNDPDEVKKYIANKTVSEGYKDNLAKAYGYYVKVNGLTWEKPRYKRVKRLPKVPTKDAVNKIIARASWRYAAIRIKVI